MWEMEWDYNHNNNSNNNNTIDGNDDDEKNVERCQNSIFNILNELFHMIVRQLKQIHVIVILKKISIRTAIKSQ